MASGGDYVFSIAAEVQVAVHCVGEEVELGSLKLGLGVARSGRIEVSVGLRVSELELDVDVLMAVEYSR